MAGVKTYNPKDVVVILGTEVISGFSEDDMITIKPVGDGITGYYGADGEVARSIDANNSLEVTITLAQTSDSNNTLMNLHLLDKETGGGLAPLSIKDLSFPIKNLYGNVNFDGFNSTYNLYSILNNSKTTLKGKIRNQDAEFEINGLILLLFNNSNSSFAFSMVSNKQY